jgi:hypothetical protein
MVKEDLETKARKAILKIQKQFSELYDVVKDLSFKLCHIIESNKDHYRYIDGNYHGK